MWTVEPTKEELSQKLSTANRSMEHMNSLLHETEATNAVLMEQITVCITNHTFTHTQTGSAKLPATLISHQLQIVSHFFKLNRSLK